MGAKDITEKILADFNDVFADIIKNVDYVPSSQEIKHVDEFLKLLQALTGDDRYYEILDLLQKSQKKEGINMCEILDRIENRGIDIGEKRGREEMANEINQLNSILLEQNRLDDLRRAVADRDYQRQLMAKYGIDHSLNK